MQPFKVASLKVARSEGSCSKRPCQKISFSIDLRGGKYAALIRIPRKYACIYVLVMYSKRNVAFSRLNWIACTFKTRRCMDRRV